MAKILLVEDDENLREIYADRIQGEGYEIATADNGETALAQAVKEKPDLIILDVMMPKISGFDVLDILRSTPETKDTKIMMMTALGQDADRERGEKLGVNRYLVKSQVTLEDMVSNIKQLLEEGPAKPATAVAPQESQANGIDSELADTAKSLEQAGAAGAEATVSEPPASDSGSSVASSDESAPATAQATPQEDAQTPAPPVQADDSAQEPAQVTDDASTQASDDQAAPTDNNQVVSTDAPEDTEEKQPEIPAEAKPEDAPNETVEQPAPAEAEEPASEPEAEETTEPANPTPEQEAPAQTPADEPQAESEENQTPEAQPAPEAAPSEPEETPASPAPEPETPTPPKPAGNDGELPQPQVPGTVIKPE